MGNACSDCCSQRKENSYENEGQGKTKHKDMSLKMKEKVVDNPPPDKSFFNSEILDALHGKSKGQKNIVSHLNK